MKSAIEKNARLLALFAITCTAIVAFVYQLTHERIRMQEQQQLLATLNAIIDKNSYNNNLAHDCHTFIDDNNKPQKAYIARFDNNIAAIALTASAPDGYNGNIDLIVALTAEHVISGIRVLKHNETPGLGDKIELRRSNWIESFNNKRVKNENDSRWKVQKDGGMFDQFTGATITPRAVVKAVKQTSLYFSTHQSALLSSAISCGVGE